MGEGPRRVAVPAGRMKRATQRGQDGELEGSCDDCGLCCAVLCCAVQCYATLYKARLISPRLSSGGGSPMLLSIVVSSRVGTRGGGGLSKGRPPLARQEGRGGGKR